MFSEAVTKGAIIIVLTGETEKVDMKPDSEESGVTERKHKDKDESQAVSRDISEKEKLEILKEIKIGVHDGIVRTYRTLKQFINWPEMKNDVENNVTVCETCQK